MEHVALVVEPAEDFPVDPNAIRIGKTETPAGFGGRCGFVPDSIVRVFTRECARFWKFILCG
jgi:hypothetical protein